MQPHRLIECRSEFRCEHSDRPAYTLDRNRAKLFGLSLGISVESRPRSREQNLERIDMVGVRGHRHDGDDPTPEAPRRRSGGPQ